MYVNLRQLYNVARVGLQLEILLPQPPECCWESGLVAVTDSVYASSSNPFCVWTLITSPDAMSTAGVFESLF